MDPRAPSSSGGSSHGYGYGQQASETSTGTEQPSLVERAESTLTGGPPEERAEYDRYSRHTGTGSGTGTASLAESMRSSRPSLESGGTSYESYEQPSVGEKIKSVFTGRTAQEQHEYEQQQRAGAGGGTTGYGSGYGSGSGTGTGTGTGTGIGAGYGAGSGRGSGTGYGSGYGTTHRQEQPSITERVEATFTGRTAQEQHDHDARQRHQRELERSRGGSSSEPGLMSQFGSMMTGTFGGGTSPQTRSTSFKQRMKESIHEIRESLTGTSGETPYGSSMESRTSYPRATSTESRPHVRTSGSAY